MTTADQWQSTFDAISDAVCVLDREGNILQCNKAMLEIASKPAAELAGRPVCRFIHGSAKFLRNCPWRRARKTKKREKSEVAIGNIWFEVTVDPILSSDHKLMGGIHVVSDITERKRAEQALRDGEAQLRQLFNTSPDARFLIAKDPIHFEWRHRGKDGREFPVEIYTQPITVDGRRCTYAEVRDISERKRAEEDLNQTFKGLPGLSWVSL